MVGGLCGTSDRGSLADFWGATELHAHEGLWVNAPTCQLLAVRFELVICTPNHTLQHKAVSVRRIHSWG